MTQTKQSKALNDSVGWIRVGASVRSEETGRLYQVIRVNHFCGGTGVTVAPLEGGKKHRTYVCAPSSTSSRPAIFGYEEVR